LIFLFQLKSSSRLFISLSILCFLDSLRIISISSKFVRKSFFISIFGSSLFLGLFGSISFSICGGLFRLSFFDCSGSFIVLLRPIYFESIGKYIVLIGSIFVDFVGILISCSFIISSYSFIFFL
jgi:hypothetical protein